jgi:hypothetical protein
MQNKILARLGKDPELKGLFLLLTEKLSNTDLQSLLIETFRNRSRKTNPSSVLNEYRDNRFYRPSEIPQAMLNRFDLLAYSLLSGDWHSLDLSPVTPLGTCTSISNLSQNRMISTIRNSELVSDSTNTMALKAALMRKEILDSDAKSQKTIHCCSSHRLLRAQSFEEEKFSAHFRVFALVSAGRDTGHFTFEMAQLEEHIRFYLTLCAKLNILREAEVHVSDFSGKIPTSLIEEMFGRLGESFTEVRFLLAPDRTEAHSYYTPLAFRIRFSDTDGRTWDLVDGGFTNWTQLLLSSRKERFLSSALGSELLFRVFPGVLKLMSDYGNQVPERFPE